MSERSSRPMPGAGSGTRASSHHDSSESVWSNLDVLPEHHRRKVLSINVVFGTMRKRLCAFMEESLPEKESALLNRHIRIVTAAAWDEARGIATDQLDLSDHGVATKPHHRTEE